MADEKPQSDEEIRPEAFQRMKQERDDAKQLLEKAHGKLEAVARRDKAREWFKDKAPDPDVAADFMLPHLSNVEPDKVAETLGSEQFNPFVSMVTGAGAGQAPPQPEPSGEGDGTGEGSGETPATPPATPGGFGGPNPAGPNSEPVQEADLTLNSPEVQRLIQANDRAGLKKLYDEGRLKEPARAW